MCIYLFHQFPIELCQLLKLGNTRAKCREQGISGFSALSLFRAFSDNKQSAASQRELFVV